MTDRVSAIFLGRNWLIIGSKGEHTLDIHQCSGIAFVPDCIVSPASEKLAALEHIPFEAARKKILYLVWELRKANRMIAHDH